MTPKLVIFDCDGVLVETESITGQLLADYFTHHGAPIEQHQVHDLFTGGTMDSAGREAMKRGAILPKGWLDEINSHIFAALRQGVEVFDGLMPLLDTLDGRGIARAVASNGPMAKMEISLGPSGLWQRFEGRIFSRQHHAPKPSPAMLLAAAKQAGVDPSEAVMIDDTTSGTRAADAAGMKAIGFAAASDAAKLHATGHPVAYSMDEVAGLLGLR